VQARVRRRPHAGEGAPAQEDAAVALDDAVDAHDT
jgi:hypothetical protein